MRIALISDIHANLEALTAVLRDIEKHSVDQIASLGDVIGYGADPSACLELVRSNCETRLMGNHESAVLGLQSTERYNRAARASTDWTRESLSESDIEFISGFELERTIGDSILVHSSPYEPDCWHYVFSISDAERAFAVMKAKLGFHGHSHIPAIVVACPSGPPRSRAGHSFEPDFDNRYLVNIGSVGQPRDNDPRACYVIFDDDQPEVNYHRVDYDIESAQSKMLATSLPEVLATRLTAGV
jgi:predicted phosphodiesterase